MNIYSKTILSLIVYLTISNTYSSFKIKDGQVILDNLDGYNLCQSKYRSGNSCYDALERFIKPKPELSWKAALLARKTMNSWAAIPFFWQAKDLKEFTCGNADLLLAVKSAYRLNEAHKEVLEKAHFLAFTKCKTIISSQLGSVLKASNEYSFKKYCKYFVKNKIIKGVLKKKCIKLK